MNSMNSCSTQNPAFTKDTKTMNYLVCYLYFPMLTGSHGILLLNCISYSKTKDMIVALSAVVIIAMLANASFRYALTE